MVSSNLNGFYILEKVTFLVHLPIKGPATLVNARSLNTNMSFQNKLSVLKQLRLGLGDKTTAV